MSMSLLLSLYVLRSDAFVGSSCSRGRVCTRRRLGVGQGCTPPVWRRFFSPRKSSASGRVVVLSSLLVFVLVLVVVTVAVAVDVVFDVFFVSR